MAAGIGGGRVFCLWPRSPGPGGVVRGAAIGAVAAVGLGGAVRFGAATLARSTLGRAVGRIITGYTKEARRRLIDRGVRPQWVLDAVRNPTKIVSKVDKLGRQSYQYIGKNATVVLNKVKKVVTVWARRPPGF